MISATFLLPFLAPIALAQQPASNQELQWDVFLNPPVPAVDPPQNYPWSPTAFTLIHGPHTAILVDAPITINSSNAVADWIREKIPGKKLTHNYITHGHGDHFFGASVLQQKFPGLEVVVTDRTLAHVREELATSLPSFWEQLFPNGQIPTQNETFTVLPRNGQFNIDGYVVNAVEVGRSDTFNTTVLHIPSLDMVVTGDVVYGECFNYLVESNTPELRSEWLHAVDQVAALKPKIVVPGHKQDFDGYGADHLNKTKHYLQTWGKLVSVSKNATDLMEKVTKAFPQRVGTLVLELSARAAFPSTA